eukprot:GHVS01085519.1.p2 GENE.GHVS01085519.1~~GHVS01085519.1.p2  ORF type:complete len:103 (+),score=22.76 GHVS01085519.1:89-397(+)
MRHKTQQPYLIFLSSAVLLVLVLLPSSYSLFLGVRADDDESPSSSSPGFLLLSWWMTFMWRGVKLCIALSPLLFICYIFFTNRTNDPKYIPSRKPDFSFNVD